MFLLLVIALFVTLGTYILINHNKALNYWKNKGVKSIRPFPVVGNFLPMLLGVAIVEFVIRIYEAYPKERYCGIHQFGRPILLLRDPELIKKVLIKDFETFSDHGVMTKEEIDPLWARNLFATNGKRWKDLRQTLSPAFTSSKMKSMYVLVKECSTQFIDQLTQQNDDVLELELTDTIKRYTVDVIATTAFGIQSNSLKERDNEFIRMGRELTDFTGLIKKLNFIMYDKNPFLANLFNIKFINDKVGNFFRSLIKFTMETRAKENIIRPDLIHLLMEAKKGRLQAEESNDKYDSFATAKESNLGAANKQFALDLTDDDMAAQAMIFFFGGFDTTATLINFCIYELVANPEIQERLSREVDENFQKFNGEIPYEGLFQMKYLDMVVSETLRKWPSGTFVDRKATKSYTITPDLNHETPLYLEAGDVCWIPVYAIHRDPQYWPDPETFDPERFNEENRLKINMDTFLPFGGGPRNCIGSRYAIMVTKLALFYLLSSFDIVATEKTHIPLEILPSNLLLSPKHGFWFGFKKRSIIKEDITLGKI